MKYIVELRKDGRLCGELIRASEEEAREIAREWVSRGCGNSAEYHKRDLKLAIYCCGNLDSVVDDDRFSELEESGLFDGDSWDYCLVRDGKVYDDLSGAVCAQMKYYGVI